MFSMIFARGERKQTEKMNLKIIIGQMRWYIMQLNKKPNTKREIFGRKICDNNIYKNHYN
jgi:hypothetical protein